VLAGRAKRAAARLLDTIAVAGIWVTLGVFATAAISDVGRARLTAYVLLIAVSAGYEIGFVGTGGQTPGKIAMRIRVVSAKNGRTPSYGAAFARWILPALLGVVVPALLDSRYLNGTSGPPSNAAALASYAAGIGVYVLGLWDPVRQGMHDKLGRTLVAVRA
jgi:uncharacterized RDD family membrane protein YckC